MSLKVKVPVAWFGPGALVGHAAVVCDGGRVTYAGPSAAAPHADDLLEVDGFLMPGVADRHVHIRLADPGAVLLGGVTAVRDLAWTPDEIFELANASELPTFTGPLIRAAGPMLTAPGGYPTASSWAPPGTGRELAGPQDAAAVVAELADQVTDSMKQAIGETQRRRKIQIEFNREHGIDPQSIRKKVSDILLTMAVDTRAPTPEKRRRKREHPEMPTEELERLIQQLEEEMHEAAKDLRFEYAARLRDEVVDLRKELKALRGAGVS